MSRQNFGSSFFLAVVLVGISVMREHKERRAPVALPRACFSLELDRDDPRCISCAHQQACAEAMGSRAGQVPLLDIKVDLQLDGSTQKISPDAPRDLASVYALAYTRIFNRPAPDTLLDAPAVAGASRELGVSPEMYIYACLLGHRTSSPERRFNSRLLVSPTAAKRVLFYREHAAREFGTTDVDAVRRLTRDGDKLRDELLASEQLFGGWVVGARCATTGNGVVGLYRQRELALSPYWLAIEPTYARWTETTAAATEEQRRHRKLVAAVDRAARPDLARMRSGVLLPAAGHVLGRRGYSPAHFRSVPQVTNAFRFWLALGDALLQLRILNILSNAEASTQR